MTTQAQLQTSPNTPQPQNSTQNLYTFEPQSKFQELVPHSEAIDTLISTTPTTPANPAEPAALLNQLQDYEKKVQDYQRYLEEKKQSRSLWKIINKMYEPPVIKNPPAHWSKEELEKRLATLSDKKIWLLLMGFISVKYGLTLILLGIWGT